MLLNYTGNLF